MIDQVNTKVLTTSLAVTAWTKFQHHCQRTSGTKNSSKIPRILLFIRSGTPEAISSTLESSVALESNQLEDQINYDV